MWRIRRNSLKPLNVAGRKSGAESRQLRRNWDNPKVELDLFPPLGRRRYNFLPPGKTLKGVGVPP